MNKQFLDVMQEAEQLIQVGVKEGTDPQFETKLAKFVELIGNKAGLPAHKREYMLREAETTSDFSNLFGTVLERSLLMKYKNITPDYRAYVKTGVQNDFRSANLLTTYGLQSAMSTVDQQGEYPADKISDGKYSIALTKYGRRFGLAWESIINDDLGALSDASARLAQAAVATEIVQATKLFVSAGGPNATLFNTSGTHPIDGVAFANKVTTALTADSAGQDALGAAVTYLRNQKDVDNNPILVTKFHLVVAPEKYLTALRVLSAAALIATGVGNSASSTTSENVIAKLPITLHVNEYLSSINTSGSSKYAWYVFADPYIDGAAAQLNFLRGHENPEICMKQSDKVSLGGGLMSPMEGNFDNDSVDWRVRHVLGGTQLDPRFCYASAATS